MIKYLVILALIILGWCPWLKADEAMNIVEARIVKMQNEHSDLCTMSVYRDTIRKVPFGYTEKVSYDCTAKDSEYGVLKATDVVFITFYKGLIGMPEKTVGKNFRLGGN